MSYHNSQGSLKYGYVSYRDKLYDFSDITPLQFYEAYKELILLMKENQKLLINNNKLLEKFVHPDTIRILSKEDLKFWQDIAVNRYNRGIIYMKNKQLFVTTDVDANADKAIIYGNTYKHMLAVNPDDYTPEEFLDRRFYMLHEEDNAL